MHLYHCVSCSADWGACQDFLCAVGMSWCSPPLFCLLTGHLPWNAHWLNFILLVSCWRLNPCEIRHLVPFAGLDSVARNKNIFPIPWGIQGRVWREAAFPRELARSPNNYFEAALDVGGSKRSMCGAFGGRSVTFPLPGNEWKKGFNCLNSTGYFWNSCLLLFTLVLFLHCQHWSPQNFDMVWEPLCGAGSVQWEQMELEVIEGKVKEGKGTNAVCHL